MVVSTRFWCLATYRSIVIDRSPSYIGTPLAGSIHNLLDYNPDTLYIAPDQYKNEVWLETDTQDNQTMAMNWGGFFLRNGSDLTGGNNVTLIIQKSDAFPANTELTQRNDLQSTCFPLVMHQFAPTVAKYWYLQLYQRQLNKYLVTSMAMVGRYYDLTARWNWESPRGQGYYNDIRMTFGGHYSARIGSEGGVFIEKRTYESLTDAQIEVIKSAWRDTRGGAYPMIITDDIPASGWNPYDTTVNPKSSRLVRFKHPVNAEGEVELGEVEIQNGLWNVILYLTEIPWTGEGKLT